MIGEWAPAQQAIGAAMLARGVGACLADASRNLLEDASVVKALSCVRVRATGPEADS